MWKTHTKYHTNICLIINCIPAGLQSTVRSANVVITSTTKIRMCDHVEAILKTEDIPGLAEGQGLMPAYYTVTRANQTKFTDSNLTLES